MKTPVPEISILLPCLNEELALPYCILEIEDTLKQHQLSAEIIIIDNKSTDRSAEIVNEHILKNQNIRLVSEMNTGYGSAYLKGFTSCTGKFIFMADADGSYSFRDIPMFIEKLKNGADLVVGNRFAHKIEAGVMPWHHKYIGNPFLSFLVKKLFDVKIHDIHCGVRAITKEGFNKIQPRTPGMEFASEMIIKASKRKLTIEETPVSYTQRLGKSKLRSITDGLRHLRFIFQSLFY